MAPADTRAPTPEATRDVRGGARGPVTRQSRIPYIQLILIRESSGSTHEWKTAVCAPADLRLIHVDEDAGVAEGTASTVAGDGAVVGPADGLLVDEFDGGVGAGLEGC